MNNLVEKVKLNKQLNIDKPIVVAVSTGVDSMVLLDILLRLKYKCIIAHVNHNKREQSVSEYSYISNYAKELGIPFEGHKLESSSSNFQHDAHIKRMQFFKAIAMKYNTDQIALAHHLDDQTETILMRIVRGSSFSGYAGIKPFYLEDELTFIRPLLEISKQEILDYSTLNKITYFNDESNKSNDYTRNRYRHEIIPLIEKENPNYKAKFKQFGEMISSADELVQFTTKQFFDQIDSKETVPLKQFNVLNQLVQIEVLKQLIGNKTDHNLEINYSQYKQMIQICSTKTPNQQIQLSALFKFTKAYDTFSIEEIVMTEDVFVEINDFGDYQINEQLQFTVSPVKINQNNSNYFQLCYNKLVFPLYLRSRKDGDKISLNIGTKKVKDVLIDQKIPMKERNNLILLSNKDSVLWIPGIKKAYQTDCENLENKLYVYEVTKC